MYRVTLVPGQLAKSVPHSTRSLRGVRRCSWAINVKAIAMQQARRCARPVADHLRGIGTTSRWQDITLTAEGHQDQTVVASSSGSFSVTTQPDSEPAYHLLASLVGCSQAALTKAAAEGQVPLGRVRWSCNAVMASTATSVAAVPSIHSINLLAEVPTTAHQRELRQLATDAMSRSMIAATLQRSGIEVRLHLHRPANTFISSMGTWENEDTLHMSDVMTRVQQAQKRIPNQSVL